MRFFLWAAIGLLSAGAPLPGIAEPVCIEEEAASLPRAPRQVTRAATLVRGAAPPAPAPPPRRGAVSDAVPSFADDPGPAIARFHLRSPSA